MNSPGQERLMKSTEGSGRQGDDGLKKIEKGFERDSDEFKGEEQQPNQGEKNEGEEGHRPTDYE